MTITMHEKITGNVYLAKNSCIHCAQGNRCFGSKLNQFSHEFASLHSRLIRRNENVFHCGDPIEAIYLVKSGTFKAYLNTSCGEQVTSFYVPGDVMEFENLHASHHEYSVNALENSSICAFPIAQFRQCMSLALPEWLIQFTTEKLKQEVVNRNILNKKSANAQIAAFLLGMSSQKRLAGLSSHEFNLPMTRDDIANYLGLASETVSRTFSRLQKWGLVKLKNRSVMLLDIQHLHCLANNYGMSVK